MNQDLQHKTMLASMNQDLQHNTVLSSMNQDLQDRTEKSALAEAAAEKKPAKKVALLKEATASRAKLEQELQHKTMLASMNQDLQQPCAAHSTPAALRGQPARCASAP